MKMIFNLQKKRAERFLKRQQEIAAKEMSMLQDMIHNKDKFMFELACSDVNDDMVMVMAESMCADLQRHMGRK